MCIHPDNPDHRAAWNHALSELGDESLARLVEAFLDEEPASKKAEHTALMVASGFSEAIIEEGASAVGAGPMLHLAEVNLRLARGLPGSEELDIDGLLGQLEHWAGLVAMGIRNLRPRFEQSPEAYENSWPYFQALVMTTVLGRNLGVRYRPELMADPIDWSDSRSRFLHGPLTGYGGTCASMPVLYVAIGRRLGWPVWLVGAKQHLFVRWEDEHERLNIEATSRGLNCHPDEHYRHWPLPIEQYEIERGWYLRNLTPRDELALFLLDRAFCLRDNEQWAAALQVTSLAQRLVPDDPNHNGYHAIATVLYQDTHGLARYEFEPGSDKLARVVDRDGPRRPEPWESWAAPLARAEHRRIVDNRHRKTERSALDSALEEIFSSNS